MRGPLHRVRLFTLDYVDITQAHTRGLNARKKFADTVKNAHEFFFDKFVCLVRSVFDAHSLLTDAKRFCPLPTMETPFLETCFLRCLDLCGADLYLACNGIAGLWNWKVLNCKVAESWQKRDIDTEQRSEEINSRNNLLEEVLLVVNRSKRINHGFAGSPNTDRHCTLPSSSATRLG